MDVFGQTALVQTLQLVWYLSNVGEWDDFSPSTRMDAVEHAVDALAAAGEGQEETLLTAIREVRENFEGSPMEAAASDFFQKIEQAILGREPVDTVTILVK